MDSAELTTVLREAASTVDPPAGFTDAVLRGGRRRRRHRRMTIAASVVAVLVVLIGGTTAVLGDERQQVATHGDLKGDQEFLDQVIAAWVVGIDHSPNAGRGVFNDLRGEPRVYWAGTTTAGRAAVVMQDAYVHPHNDLPPDIVREQTLVGLVAIDPKDGVLKLVGDQYRAQDDPPSGYFQFGPGDRTLLLVDYGTPIYVSAEPLYRTGGHRRDWRRIQATDGVAVAQLPAGVRAGDIVAVARNTSPAKNELLPADRFWFWPASGYLGTPPDDTFMDQGPSGLPWHGMNLTVGRTDVPPVAVDTALQIGGQANGLSYWHIRAGLPDGRVAILGDRQYGVRQANVYAVLVSGVIETEMLFQPEIVDQDEMLPVRFRMPDKQGWVIADYRKSLSYRTTVDGPWLDAGTSAALVPDETVQVLVDSTTVNLPR